MRKIICLFLLLPSPLFAAVGSWNGVAFTGWNGVAQTSWNGTSISCAGGGGCATTDTSLAHDEMLYGWETGDDPTPWTGPTDGQDADVVTSDPTYNTSSLTTGKPTGGCDTAWRLTLTGTAGFETKYFDKGSIIGPAVNLDIVFYIYPQVAVSGGNGRITIQSGGESTTPASSAAYEIELRDDGAGNHEVRAGSTTDSSWLVLTANSWNKVTLHLDATIANSSIQVNAGTPATFTSNAVRGVRYLHWCAIAATGEAGQFALDLMAVNSP